MKFSLIIWCKLSFNDGLHIFFIHSPNPNLCLAHLFVSIVHLLRGQDANYSNGQVAYLNLRKLLFNILYLS